MTFRITGLSPEPFRHLFGLSDDALKAHGARRVIVTEKPGFPDRIEVRDAEPGESVLLVNYVHQPADTPYRASHAVYVLEGAEAAYDAVDEIPEAIRGRTVSLRAFDAEHMMVDADVGDALAAYPVPVLAATVMQRAIYAEAAAQGKALFEIDAGGPATAETEALVTELMEYAK